MKHKLTAFLLALVMVLQVSGFSAFAQQEEENLQAPAATGELTGTETDGAKTDGAKTDESDSLAVQEKSEPLQKPRSRATTKPAPTRRLPGSKKMPVCSIFRLLNM